MNKLKAVVLSIVLMASVSAGVATLSLSTASTASAACSGLDCINDGAKKTGVNKKSSSLNDTIKTVVNVMLFIIGALAVIMLIFGGIRYVTSGGNSTQVTAAKNTIMYAIVGLLIAIFAYAIVGFVIDSFIK